MVEKSTSNQAIEFDVSKSSLTSLRFAAEHFPSEVRRLLPKPSSPVRRVILPVVSCIVSYWENLDEIHKFILCQCVNSWVWDSLRVYFQDLMSPWSLHPWLVDSSWRRVVALSVSQDESKWNPISVAELSGHLPEARRGSWDGFLKNMWGSSSKILVLSLYGDSTSIWGSVLNFTNWYYNDQWWLMMVNDG